MKKPVLLLLFFLALFSIRSISFAQGITTTVSATTICADSLTPFSVSYVVSGATLTTNTNFTIEVSDINGSFADPVYTKSFMSANLSGTESILFPLLPPWVPSGTGYRIRTNTTLPNITGSDNGTDLTILNAPTVVVSPSNPSVCAGEQVQLSASGADTYVWTPGNLTGSILPLTPANNSTYTITGTNTAGCSNQAFVTVLAKRYNELLRETMGNGWSTTADVFLYNYYSGFDAPTGYYSGSNTTVETSSPSTGYPGASGGANIFIDNNSATATSHTFQLSGINTLGTSNLMLSYGIRKSSNASNGSQLIVEYSTNGTTFTSLSPQPLPTGIGTNTMWFLVDSISGIPATQNLRLRWRQTVNNMDFRIDDIVLSRGGSQPVISASSSSANFCMGQSMNLTASQASGYLWSTGATTQIINVNQAGTYTITATDANGCSATSAPRTVNNSTAGPVFVTISGTATVCTGQQLSLTANGPAGATYSWLTPTGPLSGQVITITNPTAANSGAYTVTANVLNCSFGTSDTTINVLPGTAPATPVAITTSPVCAGQPLTFSVSNPQAGVTYNWFGPGGTTNSYTGSVVTIPVAQTSHSGTYSLVATAAGGCNSLPGVVSASVNPVPPTPVVTNNSPVCAGSTLHLSAINGTPFATYSWFGPANPVSNLPYISVPNVQTSAAGVYSVYASSAGCISAPGTTTVTVGPALPTPVVSNNGPICVGQQLQLSAAGTYPPGTNFMWTKGGANWFSGQYPTVTTGLANYAGTYTVTATANGCTSAQATTSVVINPGPGYVGINAPQIVCPGSALTLSATNTGTQFPYTWSGPNGFVASGAIATIPAVTSADYGTYSVTAGSGNCFVTSTWQVSPPPALNISAPGPVCPGSDILLHADSAFYLATGYSWTGPNGFTSNQMNPVIPNASAAHAGAYTAYAVYNGCLSAPAVVQVAIGPLQVNASSAGSVNQGGTLYLSASGSPGPYSWTGPNNFSAVGSNPYILNAAPLHSGIYTVTVSAAGCPSVSSVTNVQVNPMNLISGKVFNDLNNNSVQNPGEPGMMYKMVDVQPGNYTAQTNHLGEYSVYVPAGTYSLTVSGLTTTQASNPLSGSVTFGGTGLVSNGHDFAIYSTVNQDLKVTVTELSCASPGFATTHKITLTNYGGAMVNATVRYLKDSVLVFNNATSPPATSGDTLSWNVWIGAYQSWPVYVNFTTPAGTPLGWALNSIASVTPVIGDATPANNYFNLDQLVTGSWDPNDKLVQPAGDITTIDVMEGEDMIYTIRFQNTGTAPAVNVLVSDTLSANLDLTSFQMLSASHNHNLNMRNPGILEWHFPTIMLPDSNTNEPESHGYVQYSIRPKATLVTGDQIENTAHIFFDFNEAIVTNTTVTAVGALNVPHTHNFAALQLYPNPTTGNFTIKLSNSQPGNLQIRLVNMLGQEVYSEAASAKNTTFEHQLQLQELPEGMYLLHVWQGDKVYTSRVVIQK